MRSLSATVRSQTWTSPGSAGSTTHPPAAGRGRDRRRAHTADKPAGFVHGDLWHGNTIWDGDVLSGILDWDCGGVGAAGVDLGSLR